MAGVGADFWVCAGCRSVNNLRAKQCYNCRTPRERAAVDPTMIDPSTKGGLREIELPDYASPRPFAIVASILILGVAGLQVLSTIVSTSLILQILDGSLPAETEFLELGLLSLAALGVGLLALISWSAWLASAVGAMPALGLGYPPGNSLTAFVENFLPGLNLLRVPAIVRDIVRRLEPQEGRGDVFIFVAWIGLFGGLIVPRVGGWLGFFGADTVEGTVRNQLVVQAIAVTLVLVGAIFLVFLIWWIQERIEERRAAQLRGEPPPEPVVAEPHPATLVTLGTASTTSTTATSDGARLATAGAPVAASPDDAPIGSSAVPVPSPGAPVPGPLGTVRPAVADDPALHRPLTAVAPTVATPEAALTPRPAPPPPAEPPVVPTPPGPAAPAAPVAATEPEAVEPPAPSAPAGPSSAGPRLVIRVGSESLTASLEGDPEEPITLEELREAAPALARAGGSATIVVADDTPALASTQVLDLLRAHGVRTEQDALQHGR